MKISPEIEKLIPYSPGKPISEVQREYKLDHVIKLASNEAPYAPSPKVIKALKMALPQLNRYPDSQSHKLTQTFSKHYGVLPENLIFGNGSNELIDLLIRVFCVPGQCILTSQAAFIAYKICAQTVRVQTIETPMAHMCFDLEAIKAELQKRREQPVRLVFIANPNNPTGTYLNEEQITDFLNFMKSHPETLVVIDEAYTEFVRAPDYPNSLDLFRRDSYASQLVVLKTLSKVYGLAGLRLGALIGSPQWVNYIHRVRNPFNVNHLAQVAGVAAIQDSDYVHQHCQVIWQGLDYLYGELDSLSCRYPLKYLKSQTNFILLDFGREAYPIHKRLLKRGLILRPVAGYGLPNCLRLTVGLPHENQQAVETLKEVLSEEAPCPPHPS